MGWVEAWVFRGWPRPERPSRLAVDLTQPSVCGLKLGATAARVREVLGAPASWREKRRGCWAYPAWGVRVDVPADRELESFSLELGDPPQGISASRLPWRRFEGQLLLPGRSLLASRVRREDLETALSAPDSREELLGDTVLTWERRGWLLEATFAPDGAPLSLGVHRSGD